MTDADVLDFIKSTIEDYRYETAAGHDPDSEETLGVIQGAIYLHELKGKQDGPASATDAAKH